MADETEEAAAVEALEVAADPMPAPVVEAAEPVTAEGLLSKAEVLAEIIRGHLRNSPVSRDTEAWNHLENQLGAIVADNGGFFSISITPDDRYPEGCFDHLSAVGIENFEVIQTTGPR